MQCTCDLVRGQLSEGSWRFCIDVQIHYKISKIIEFAMVHVTVVVLHTCILTMCGATIQRQWYQSGATIFITNAVAICDYFTLYAVGPVVESNMTLTCNTRAAFDSRFKLSFNVSLGLPSRIICTRTISTTDIIYSGRGFVSGVEYEVIRPLYASTSQSEITRVSFQETFHADVKYSCTVYVEGRTNIASATNYAIDLLGSATSTVVVAGE